MLICVIFNRLRLTVAGMSRKRWWRSHAGHLSRFFSRINCPGVQDTMAQFLQSRRKINLSRFEKLSRAGFTKLVNGNKFGVMMKLSRCDAKIVTSFLLIPAVVWRLSLIFSLLLFNSFANYVLRNCK